MDKIVSMNLLIKFYMVHSPCLCVQIETIRSKKFQPIRIDMKKKHSIL